MEVTKDNYFDELNNKITDNKKVIIMAKFEGKNDAIEIMKKKERNGTIFENEHDGLNEVIKVIKY